MPGGTYQRKRRHPPLVALGLTHPVGDLQIRLSLSCSSPAAGATVRPLPEAGGCTPEIPTAACCTIATSTLQWKWRNLGELLVRQRSLSRQVFGFDGILLPPLASTLPSASVVGHLGHIESSGYRQPLMLTKPGIMLHTPLALAKPGTRSPC